MQKAKMRLLHDAPRETKLLFEKNPFVFLLLSNNGDAGKEETVIVNFAAEK